MSKTFAPLFADAAALEGGTHEFLFDHTDLTEATAATGQTIDIFGATGLKQMVEVVRLELIEPFQDTADAANNTTTFAAGVAGDTAALLAATQGNLNGTEVYIKAGTGTKSVYSADTTVILTVGAPAAGKTLAALNKGKARLVLNINYSRQGR